MATRRRSASKSVKKSDTITEEDVNAAISVLTRDYFQDVDGVVDDIERAVKKGEITDDESLTEYLEQTVDGSARVIYTFQAKIGLLVSKNEDAYQDETGEPPSDPSKAMYFAMIADVRDRLPEFEFED